MKQRDVECALQLFGHGTSPSTVAMVIGVTNPTLEHCIELYRDLRGERGIAPAGEVGESPGAHGQREQPRQPADGNSPAQGHLPPRRSPPVAAGDRFGRLEVLKDAGRDRGGNALVQCACDCGIRKKVRRSSLLQGNTRSCGCYGREKLRERWNYRADLRVVERPPRTNMRCFAQDEREAIEAALEAGRVTRIENGEWPDSGRLGVERFDPRNRASKRAS